MTGFARLMNVVMFDSSGYRQEHALTLLAALVVLTAGCLGEAPRGNPLDPNSENFLDTGSMTGRTTRFYPPYVSLGNVEVRLTPGPYVAESRADGSFALNGIPSGSYRLEAAKDGFLSQPDSIHIEYGRTTDAGSVRLDGLPVISGFQVVTIHVSRWWPQEDLYRLDVSAEVQDPDGLGDIEQVRLDVPSIGFNRPMRETSIVGRFELRLPADSLPASSLHSLQGTGFEIEVVDAAGFHSESLPKSIVRVIDETPIALEPQGLQTVSANPTLVWQDAFLAFPFTYRIDVVLDQANVQTVVRTIDRISSDVTSHTLETLLAPGTYFWTVSVVDEFGNRSRSKEAGFVVE